MSSNGQKVTRNVQKVKSNEQKVRVTAAGFEIVYERTLNRLAKPAKWLSCVVSTHLCGAFAVCYYPVTYEIQSESTFYSLSECQWTLCSKELLVKELLSRIPLQSLKLQIWCLLWARSSLTFRQTIEWRFTLNLVRDMIIAYSQMHRTNDYSQHSSII